MRLGGQTFPAAIGLFETNLPSPGTCNESGGAARTRSAASSNRPPVSGENGDRALSGRNAIRRPLVNARPAFGLRSSAGDHCSGAFPQEAPDRRASMVTSRGSEW